MVDLLLSPHPDDLVYSAYSALADRTGPKVSIVFFNLSMFARGSLLPKLPITFLRTVEDMLIMWTNRVKSSYYLFLPDSTARRDRSSLQRLPQRPRIPPPRRMFAPLGVGEHEDHLLVREVAISWWQQYGRAPEMNFYEDLPYAARSDNLEEEEDCIADELRAHCGHLKTTYRPLTAKLLSRKLFFSRLYLSQTEKSELFLTHAIRIGRLSDSGYHYAERFYRAGTS